MMAEASLGLEDVMAPLWMATIAIGGLITGMLAWRSLFELFDVEMKSRLFRRALLSGLATVVLAIGMLLLFAWTEGKFG